MSTRMSQRSMAEEETVLVDINEGNTRRRRVQ
jgi:hypothetical protein